jgi:cytochrome P450
MRSPTNVVDFTSPDFIADPYPSYARLRQERPVCWDEKLGSWVITRYDDVHLLLRDKRWASSQLDELMARLPASDQPDAAPLREILTGRLVLTDNPAHQRIRSLMQLAFTPRRVELLRPAIQAIVDELLDQIVAAGRADLIADFADPLPGRAIAAMLGLPPGDRLRFKSWTDDIYGFMGFSAEPVSIRAKRGTASARELKVYLTQLFADRRREPRDDVLSGMVQAEEQGDKLSETELFSNVVGMLNASHETTTNLIANTVLALLRSPDQWQRLKEDLSLVTNAIEEGLRYESPVQMVLRRAAEDVKFSEVTVPRGDRAVVVLGAANRDPNFYEDPDRFDLDRGGVKHVAFGGGPHFCLGAALGRLEGELALAAICQRLPNLRLTGEPLTWRPLPLFRGLVALPVAV